MRKTASAFLLCFLLAAGSAQANHLADTYVIPVAGHTVGAFGTVWMSDIAIRNISTSPLTVQLIFVETGDQNFDNIQPLVGDNVAGSIDLVANETVMLTDVLEGYRGRTNSLGAIVLGGNRPFSVTSRAYSNQSPVGETIPPTRDFLENSTEQADNVGFAYMPGISQNAQWRTNIGFVAGAAGTANQFMTVEVTVRGAAGGVLGTRSYIIPPGAFAHHQFNIRSIVPSDFAVGSVEVRATLGEGAVVPYASLIDNASGEAAFIQGISPETTPSNGFRFVPNVFQSLFKNRVNLY